MYSAFLTDYRKQIYVVSRSNSHLKLFLSLVPGSEIISAEYDGTPANFNTEWYNNRYIQDERRFVQNPAEDGFINDSLKINSFLELWSGVISKLNFVYQKEADPFLFNKRFDSDNLTLLLQESATRCQRIIVDNFNHGTIGDAKYNIGRETILNIYL